MEVMKIHYCLCKIKRNRISFENQSRIKTIWEKIGFLKLFENWRLENYLKIEFFLNKKIIIIMIMIMIIKNKCENWNLKNLELNLEIRIFEEVFKNGILKINT